MADAPRSTGDSPGETAAQDKIKDHIRHAGAAVRETGQDAAARGAAIGADVAGQVKDDALAATEKGKKEIAGRLQEMADAVHRSGEQLEGQQDWLAQLVERGADELAQFASTVRSNDLRGLLGKLEDLARRQPVLFVGAAMAAGFASARLGKVAISRAPGTPANEPVSHPTPHSKEGEDGRQ